jgi:ATP-dependent DNA helicase RecG
MAKALRESESLELKRSTAELREAVVSVAAILNKGGRGRLYFGVANDGTVIGQTVSTSTLRDVSRAVAEGIEPRIYPKVERVRMAGKDCVAVKFSGSDGPYLAHGRAYMRVADEDRQLSVRELERLFLARARDGVRWEAEPSGRKISEVDETTLRRFVKKANEAGRIDFEYAGVRSTLNKLNLLAGNKLLKAGELMFCEENPVEVQAAVFAGTDKRTFLDIKVFKGTVFDLLKQSETYVKEHMDWKVEFGGLERKEIPEVPIDALREALVNSLCHRDYRNPKGNEVAVFKDRVEIYNPGDFPEGRTPEDFLSGKERSILRNPLIAETLFKCKDIERWGSGLKRIADECTEHGVGLQFEVLKTGFLVTFTRRPAESLLGTGSPIGSHKGSPKPSRKRPQEILALIAKRPDTTIDEIAAALRISSRAVKKHVRTLKADGALRRLGGRKEGHWEVGESPATESGTGKKKG